MISNFLKEIHYPFCKQLAIRFSTRLIMAWLSAQGSRKVSVSGVK